MARTADMLESIHAALKFIVRRDAIPDGVVLDAADAAASKIRAYQQERRRIALMEPNQAEHGTTHP